MLLMDINECSPIVWLERTAVALEGTQAGELAGESAARQIAITLSITSEASLVETVVHLINQRPQCGPHGTG